MRRGTEIATDAFGKRTHKYVRSLKHKIQCEPKLFWSNTQLC